MDEKASNRNRKSAGLICALDKEYKAAVSRLDVSGTERRVAHFDVLEGSIGGRSLVLVCCGTGKSSAAAASQFIFERYDPDILVNFGTGGSLTGDLDVGDVVIATRLYQGDFGVVHPDSFAHTGEALYAGKERKYAKEYVTRPELVAMAEKVAESGSLELEKGSVHFKPIVTCDQVVFSQSYRKELRLAFEAVLVDMEGAAVAHVASMHGRSFLVVKAVSDTEEYDLDGFEHYIQYAEEGRPACWWRRARFAAVHPGSIARMRQIQRGMTSASENASIVAIKLASSAAADAGGAMS